MALNTYPYSPFPASTEQLHKGDNEELQAQIDAIKDGTDIDSFGDVEAALSVVTGDITDLETDKADLEVVAAEFDAEAGVYDVGDLVTHEGKLYEFTSAHSTAGAWDASEVTEKTVADEIDTLKSGLTNATTIQTLSFADSQKCTLYTGTDGWRGANRIQVYGGHLVHVDFDITLTENVDNSWVLRLPEGVYPTCAVRSDVAYINKDNGRIYANGNTNDVINGSFNYMI